ncbi:MAG: hypothetical protein WCS17_01850 [Prevotella sp.]
MDKKTQKKIREEIRQSTIPEEMKVMYILASACQSMVYDSYDRIKSAYIQNGFRCVDNDILTGLADYCKTIKMATFSFFERIEPRISNATFGRHDKGDDNITQSDIDAYDNFNANANEVCRLILLYADRSSSEGAASEIFKYLRNMPSFGVFTDADIDRFNMK